MISAKEMRSQERMNEFVSSSGNRFREEFVGELQQNGEVVLVSTGFIDTQKMIESEAVGASVPEIIARALAGDVSVVREEGFYADVTQMPSTYAEILNTVNNGKRIFEELDPDIRAKFEFSFEKWFATMNTDEWYKNMNVIKDEKVVSDVSDKKKNEIKDQKVVSDVSEEKKEAVK